MRYRRRNQALALLLLVGVLVGGSPAVTTAQSPANGGPRSSAPLRKTEEPPREAKVIDVALSADGTLQGVIASENAVPVAGAAVEIRDRRGEVVASTESDCQGQFAVAGLRGGSYVLTLPSAFEGAATASRQAIACRVWSQQAAPPSAVEQVLIVADSATVRGQIPRRPIMFLIPVAAAVGVYLAVKEREERPHGS